MELIRAVLNPAPEPSLLSTSLSPYEEQKIREQLIDIWDKEEMKQLKQEKKRKKWKKKHPKPSKKKAMKNFNKAVKNIMR